MLGINNLLTILLPMRGGHPILSLQNSLDRQPGGMPAHSVYRFKLKATGVPAQLGCQSTASEGRLCPIKL